MSEERREARIYLNNTPCQFTHSKTKRAIDYIHAAMASRCKPNSENGIHNITVIVHDNSLLDSTQWKLRLGDRALKVASLSSDAKSTFRDLHQFMGSLTAVEKPNDLIDVLVMCNNHVRDKDIYEICTTLSNKRISFSNIGIHQIELTVMYDEVDVPQNLNNACKFIKYCKENELNFIESIHLITATPFQKFWKKLKNITDIISLDTFNDMITIPPSGELKAQYKQIKDHNIVYTDHIDNTDGVLYFQNIHTSFLKPSPEPVICFCPTTKRIADHDTVTNFILNSNRTRDAVVVEINSKVKGIYIGTKNNVTKIDIFNKDNGLTTEKEPDCEIYNTLKKIKELYPDKDIYVNGYNCLNRGVTLQTKGFNFTDVVIPLVKDPATRVQLAGRSNGGSEFIQNTNNIYIHQKCYNELNEYIDYSMKLIQAAPVKVSSDDFRTKTDKEKDMVRWRVPKKIHLSDADYEKAIERIGKSNKFKNKKWVLEQFQRDGLDLDVNIEPKDYYWSGLANDETVYKRSIPAVINAFNDNTPYCSLKKQFTDKGIKTFGVYIDDKAKDIYLCIYDGNKEI
jgi:hypothetical protein